jgi:hypothetical protein
VFCFRDSAGEEGGSEQCFVSGVSAEERGSEQCFVSGTVQKREVVSSDLFQ